MKIFSLYHALTGKNLLSPGPNGYFSRELSILKLDSTDVLTKPF